MNLYYSQVHPEISEQFFLITSELSSFKEGPIKEFNVYSRAVLAIWDVQ